VNLRQYRLATIAIPAFIFGVALSGCDLEVDEAGDAHVAPDPDSTYLFGFTIDELREVHDLLDLGDEVTEDEWLVANIAPFDCDLYGDFCDFVGRSEAERITAESYELALDGVGRDELSLWIAEEADAAAFLRMDRRDEVLDGALESAGNFFSQGISGNTPNQRQRLRIYSMTPAIGQGWGRAQCKYQSRNGAFWTTEVARHIAEVRLRVQTFNTLGAITTTWMGGWQPSGGGYRVNVDQRKTVYSPRQWSGVWGPWNSGTQEKLLHVEGCCTTTHGNWSSGRVCRP
jgi:hypothetical protein